MVPPALAPLIPGAIITSRDGCPAHFTLVGAMAALGVALVYRVRSVR